MERKLKVGEWVEVLSKEEILKTLDERGMFEGVPFMPEMYRFCGKRFRVHKRAHKTCDYSTPYPCYTRWLKDTVHLNTRCGGEAHDGCQAGCELFWKTAWLKVVSGPQPDVVGIQPAPAAEDCIGAYQLTGPGPDDAHIWASIKIPDPEGGKPKYMCQMSEVPHATTPLQWWDIRQYVEDWTSGNVSLWQLFCGFVWTWYYNLSQAGIGLGRPMRWLYNMLRPLWGGSMFPRMPGMIPEGQPTPTVSLNLQPGELVRVKSHEEILKTVTLYNMNRGMTWDAELVPYCGKEFRVLKRVTKIIDERSAKMIEMKTACIILDNVVCQARYSDHRMFCPKAMYPYWREIWLERVGTNEAGTAN